MLGHQNMQLRLMCLCLDMLLLLLNVCVWPLWWGWHARLGSMATEFKYTRQTASAKVPLGTYCFYANKAGILETAEPFLTVRFPVLFSPQTNMFISATTWIPNNVLLQVHSRLPRDSRFAPDPRTTAPSQPGGHNLCTAKTCSQINAGMSRRTRNEDEWAQKAEKQRAGPVPATVLQTSSPVSQRPDGQMPARTGGTTQSGNMTKIWTLRYDREWLKRFRSVGALPSQKQPFHFLFSPDQQPECVCVLKSLFL